MERKSIILLLITLFNLEILIAQNSGNVYRVSLKKEMISDTVSTKPGMGNLFFSNDFNSKEIKVPLAWENLKWRH